jgi:glycosyltransferase involved in cell wall biosynthesis
MTWQPLRVCLDARLRDGVAGGIQQFIMGLASGLSRLQDGDEQYLFLSYPQHRAWLEPHLRGACAPLDVAAPTGPPSRGSGAVMSAMRWAFDRVADSRFGGMLPARIPNSDGAAERSGSDVVHLTLQAGFTTALPTIYQPYDLQHLHLPQFFTPFALKWRVKTYSTLAAAARSVVVMSSWVKEDVVRNLHVSPQNVRVIPWAPVTEEYPEPEAADLARIRKRYALPEAFALYPAQTFAHKNHLGLIEAVDVARRRGVDLHVVCPGTQTPLLRVIQRRLAELGLDGRVRFVGYVSPVELRCLYRLARILVFPTLFEGGGMPVFEAFAARLPVACSDVTCLPKQASGAAVLFDPRDPNAIADAMILLWADASARANLVDKGVERVAAFTWERTARTYRALYREVAGRPLTSEDRELLAAPAET